MSTRWAPCSWAGEGQLDAGGKCGHGGRDGVIRTGSARERGDDVHVRGFGEGLCEGGLCAAEVLRQVEDDEAELVGSGRCLSHQPGGGVEQVGRVVPAAAEPLGGVAVQAHDVADERAGLLESTERGVVDVAEGVVCAGEGSGGGGVLGHPGEAAGLGVERRADRSGGDRPRRGATPLAGESRRGELLGEPGERGEPDAGHAVAALGEATGEVTAGHDAGDVVGDEHGDRSHRVVLLGLRHDGAQRLQRLAPVCREAHLCAHAAPSSTLLRRQARREVRHPRG